MSETRVWRSRDVGRQKRSGWREIDARMAAGKHDLPIVPSAWELLLRELQLCETDAPRLAAGSGPEGERLRRFVKAEAKRRYVPEDVLSAMGLRNLVEESITLGWATLRYQPRQARSAARGGAE